ncbi:MAG: hypothetical protein IJ029_01220, partial [Lachnospiraceae bacterium]|nr:hypothetical protein [Lachnospiraceae bacterium]
MSSLLQKFLSLSVKAKIACAAAACTILAGGIAATVALNSDNEPVNEVVEVAEATPEPTAEATPEPTPEPTPVPLIEGEVICLPEMQFMNPEDWAMQVGYSVIKMDGSMSAGEISY